MGVVDTFRPRAQGPILTFAMLFVLFWFLPMKIVDRLHWYSDDELRFMYENGQGHLTLFCIVFVWLRGRPSPVRSPIQDPWFMYQNRLGPSGGIYYPNFVPCFVVVQLNNVPIRLSVLTLTFANVHITEVQQRWASKPFRAKLGNKWAGMIGW